MKKSNLFFVGFLTLLMTSCSQDDQMLSLDSTSNCGSMQPKVVLVDKGEIFPITRNSVGIDSSKLVLSFNDEHSFLNFKNSLENISDDEKQKVIENLGFRNLHNVSYDADTELENIGKIAIDEQSFRRLYAQYVEKYNGLLIKNYVDTTDLSLYVPDGDNINSYLVNETMQVVIGKKIFSLRLRNKLPEIVENASTVFRDYDNGISICATEDVNHFVYSPKKNKKVYFNAYLKGRNLWVQMYTRKKMWYGWKNDPHRQYFFDSYLSSNFKYQCQIGAAVISQRLPRYIFTNNVSNGFNIILGIVNGQSITGEIRTWTDMTSEHDSKGNQLNETIEGHIVPKCLLSKAKICKISLKIQ